MGFSENLVKYRKIKAFTQDDFAEMLGVTRQSVSKWENGESTPDINRIIQISKCLEVSIDTLFDNETVIKTNQTVTTSQDVKIELKSNFLRTFIICAITLCVGIALGFLCGNWRKDAYINQVNNGTLSEIEISSFEYMPIDDFHLDGMQIEFVSSSYDEEQMQYTIYADADEDYYDTSAKVEFKSGICHSVLNTKAGVRYDIILEITESDNSRYITLGEKIWGDGSGNNQ